MKKTELRKIIKEEYTRIINEDRISSEYGDYTEKKERVIVYLKNQKAGSFTKLIQSITEIDALKKETDEKKRALTVLQKQYKLDKADLDVKLQGYIEDLFDASELTNTLVVECYGSSLNLAKKTAVNEPSVKLTQDVDYEAAWKKMYLLLDGKDGIKQELDDILNECTNITKLAVAGKKRKVTTNIKSEGLLSEDNLFMKLYNAVKNSLAKYLVSFKQWLPSFKNRLNDMNVTINNL